MSRFFVAATFTWVSGKSLASAQQISDVSHALDVRGSGGAVLVPAGWAAWLFTTSTPGPAEAAHEAGEFMRAAAADAGLPDAVMTDVYIKRIGSWAARQARDDPPPMSTLHDPADRYYSDQT